MEKTSDLLQCKQTVSARLLRAGLRGNAVGMKCTNRIKTAVVSMGRNVHAVGIGKKIVDGKVTKTTCVRIFVPQKISASLLSQRDLLPENIDGIPTDIIETPPAFITKKMKKLKKSASSTASCTDNKRKRQRPVIAGISAAHVDVTAGTIAYFCRSTRHGDDPSKVHVLSNNHVFADVNQANIGDNLYQPGPADGGIADDHFANLHRFENIQLGGINPNKVDAAIGGLLEGVEFKPEICMIGKIKGTNLATEDMKVRKHGRTSSYTEGIITDESYDALVGMDHNDPSVVGLFENQMRIERIAPYAAFGLGGDSGSLVVEKSAAKAVGLYFAGPDSGIYGIANHIGDVLSELQIELL